MKRNWRRWVLPVVLALIATVPGTALLLLSTPTTGGAGLAVTTLGNQERQDIVAANQWVEGNIDFWLESHLYDTEVRLDAGTSPTTLPSNIDFGMSFFFANNNAIVIDWTQDWHVTFNKTAMYWTKTSAPAGAPFECSTPPNIVSIPVNGKSILEPQGGSVCLRNVDANETGNPATGWADLQSLPLATLNQVIPKRNEPCSSISGGLCTSGAETESAPVTEHYFRLNLSAMFGPGGIYAKSFPGTWPNLAAGASLGFYFRNHLAMTSVWETAVGAPGGGSQPQFCINTAIGAVLNTNYNRCGWTQISRFGAGFASGSKNHGDVFAPGIGDKTIPLPNVVPPTGFITVCKVVTGSPTDFTGSLGALTNGWSMTVTGPFGTSETKLTGSSTLGCAKFGPLFPGTYQVGEALLAGYTNIGTVVSPSGDRAPGFGTNPTASNPVNVTLSFTEAQSGTGPTVTFVNFLPSPQMTSGCTVTIRDVSGNVASRTYAIAGDTVTFNFTVTNTGNEPIFVNQTHTNTAQFGPALLFAGTLYPPGGTHSTLRSYTVLASDLGSISDVCTTTATDAFGNTIPSQQSNCSFVVKAPNVAFEKHPVASDNVFVVPGQELTYTIKVNNTGGAPAVVSVSDALGAGQTLLNGGPLTDPEDLPTVTPTSPGGGDFAAPFTIAGTGLILAPGATIFLNFTVLVTATVDGAQLTGTMTLHAANTNAVGFDPNPNTAQNLVTVTRPVLKLTAFGYTNSPNGTPTQGVVNGTTVYTVTFTNFGTNASVLSGALVVSTSSSVGKLTCWASTGPATLTGCTLSWSGVVLTPNGQAGNSVTFTVTVSYTNMVSGDLVIADLTASYTSGAGGTSFTPSGTPARIEFTIQSG